MSNFLTLELNQTIQLQLTVTPLNLLSHNCFKFHLLGAYVFMLGALELCVGMEVT